MKIVIKLVLVLALVSPAFATGSGNNQNTVVNNYITVNESPGPQGEQGEAGPQGAQGPEGDSAPVSWNVGAMVQWHEWDNHLSANSGYRYSIKNNARDEHIFDVMMIGYRFGKSAEDRRIDELKKEIAKLRLETIQQPSAAVAQTEPSTRTTIKGRKR